MSVRQIVPIIAAACLILLPALRAQEIEREPLRGRVTDSDGNPIPKITLVFEDEKSAMRKEYVAAEPDGTFFKALPASNYRLIGTVPACFEPVNATVRDTDGFTLVLAWNPERVAERIAAEVGGTVNKITASASLDYQNWKIGKLNFSLPQFNFDFTKYYSSPGGISVETRTAHVQECNAWKKSVWDSQPGVRKP